MILLLLINFMMVMMTISQKLVSMGAILLMSASIVTILTAVLASSWYAFILFLIYITGLLVLFGYFLALSPNSFHTEKKCFKAYFFPLMVFLFVPVSYIFNQTPSFKLIFEKNAISIIAFNNSLIYLFLVVVLLLMLLMVVSLTYKSPSPLRNHI